MPFQPASPNLSITGFDGCWAHVPCHGETESGDGLFEEVGRSDGRHLLLLVDVAGHGPPAAAIVSFVFSHLQTDPVSRNRSPSDLLILLNILLEPVFIASTRFVAAQAILVDSQSGTLVGGNAGQPEPRTGPPGGVWALWPMPGGPPLGVTPLVYSEGHAPLAPGERVLVLTDGVTEAGAKQGPEPFQGGPLDGWLSALPAGLPAAEVVSRLLTALQSHVNPPWPEDDTTIVCLIRHQQP